tara:strand:- start:6580 stop:7788 length:1209 start_codon:yes stop_codon:yes gene_type:complete
MKKYTLSNGLTVIHKKTPSKSVAIEVMVRVGSNNETMDQLGISHFTEHMLFEGTKKRKHSRDITSEIERCGGHFNAYTSGDRTAYYVKALAKHFNGVLDVISDILVNSTFRPSMVEKEKKVILKEIHMVMDDPRFYQWVLFQKSLFKTHPARNPTTGTVKTVSSLDRSQIVGHVEKYYNPLNTVITIVGGVDGIIGKVEKAFSKMHNGGYKQSDVFSEGPNQKKEVVIEKRKTLSSYMVMGHKIPPRSHKDSYVFDVITSILGKGQSGRIFDEIRNKRGLSYEVGVNCETTFDHGFLAIHASVNKEKINLVKNLVMKEFKKLDTVSEKELSESKGFIEGSYVLEMEDTHKLADQLSFWELIGDAKLSDSYLKKIKAVTRDDVTRVSRKFLNENYTLTLIKPK